jgi:outer membrane protein OmpA-like peptidoglycan-associated protein
MKCITLIAALAACISGCDGRDDAQSSPLETTAEEDADFVRMATAGRLLPDLQSYLTSDAPAPRTFNFDRLAFSSGSSKIQAADERTIYALANALRNHPSARIRIIGYADPEFDGADYKGLPLRRAQSIAEALREAGVDGSRLETAAGRTVGKGRVAQLLVLQK